MKTCVCGDVEDAHGGDSEFPGSTSCTIDGCECVAFEDDGKGDLVELKFHSSSRTEIVSNDEYDARIKRDRDR